MINPPQFNCYRNTVILDILTKVYGLEPVNIFDDPELAKLCIFFRSKLPWKQKLIFSRPFNFYSWPEFISPDQEFVFFSTLKDYSRIYKINVTFCSLIEYGFGKSVPFAYNPILNIKGDQKALESLFSRNLRNNLRRNNNKAYKTGISIDISRSENDLLDFYLNILIPNYVKKHRMIFQPYSLFVELFRTSNAYLVTAKLKQKIIGGLILIPDQKGIHYAWGASQNIDNISIGTLMIRFALGKAVMDGLSFFDFGSTALSDNILLDFKMRWGCTNYIVRKYYSETPPRIIDMNNDLMLIRRIYKYLPLWLLRKTMPTIVKFLVS